MNISLIIPPDVMESIAITYLKITDTDVKFAQARHREAVENVGFECLMKWNKEKCGPNARDELFGYLRHARNWGILAARDFKQVCSELKEHQYVWGKTKI